MKQVINLIVFRSLKFLYHAWCDMWMLRRAMYRINQMFDLKLMKYIDPLQRQLSAKPETAISWTYFSHTDIFIIFNVYDADTNFNFKQNDSKITRNRPLPTGLRQSATSLAAHTAITPHLQLRNRVAGVPVVYYSFSRPRIPFLWPWNRYGAHATVRMRSASEFPLRITFTVRLFSKNIFFF